MITVNGTAIDFDITAPEDLRRYRAAGERMTAAAQAAGDPPQDVSSPLGFAAYIDYLDGQCRLLTGFIDEAFGEGTCNALLGPKTSLEKLLDACDAIGAAVEQQGQDVGVKIKKYLPNRATRRGAK